MSPLKQQRTLNCLARRRRPLKGFGRRFHDVAIGEKAQIELRDNQEGSEIHVGTIIIAEEGQTREIKLFPIPLQYPALHVSTGSRRLPPRLP